jgi:hypothetical protein
LCTLFTPLQQVAAAEPPSYILIGEVQWSGSSRSTADEWLELWNVGTESVDITGWSLVGASEKPIFFPTNTLLAPRQTLLVANYPATSDKTLLSAQTIAIATSSLSLSNDHLLIELHDQTGLIQDTAGTGAKPLAGASTPINTSMIRASEGAGNLSSSWLSATSTFFLSAPDLGTPGVCDHCVLMPSPVATPDALPTPPSTITTSTEVLPPLEFTEPEAGTTTEEALDPQTIEESTPESIPPLLEPEEAALYGVTEQDLTEEQPESLATSSTLYESPSLGTSTPALPALQETPSSSTPVFVTSTDENTADDEDPPQPIVAPTSTSVVTTTIALTTPTSTTAIATSTSAPTTTPVAPVSAVSTPAPSNDLQPPVVLTADPSSFDPVITELMAAPLTNQEEWIELKLPDNASPLRYLNWKLEADEKTIFTLTTASLQALNTQGAYLLPAWKTAKLKNTGATVRLVRADGTIAQEVRYGNSLKGTSWMRDDASTSWKLTRHPTKGFANILEAVSGPMAVTKPTKPAPRPRTAPSKKPTNSIGKKKTASTSIPTSTGDIKTLGTAAAKSAVELPENTSNKTTVKKIPAPKKAKTPASPKTPKKTTKKTSTKKSLVTPSSVTHFEQIPPEQLSPRVRVRLQGVVGSTAGVFGKQRFVLLAPDGRGLLVKTTTQQPSPALGDTIEITGLLFANDEGVQLQMESSDLWKSAPLAATTSPRTVEWNAPGIEDQWSFTRLEGAVTDSRPSSITLEAQIGEVTIPIKAVLGYRAQRVKVGDTVEVSGIFDGRGGTWKIQPSKASDIVIVRHPEPASQIAATSPSDTKAPWNAIGIALGSIGAIEGIRRWLEKRKATQLIPKQPVPVTN